MVPRRASEACQGCRTRKVRCDIIGTPPCMRCKVEGAKCILLKGAQRRSSESRAFGPQPMYAPLQTTPIPPWDENSLPEDSSYDLLSSCRLNNLLSGASDTSGGSLDFAHTVDDRTLANDTDIWMINQPLPTVEDIGLLEPLDTAEVRAPESPTRNDISHLSTEDQAYLSSQKVWELPEPTVQKLLLESFFLYVHPSYPVVEEEHVWKEFENGVTNMSFLVYRAILCTAVPYMSDKTAKEMGFLSSIALQQLMYARTKLLVDFEIEEDGFALAQSYLLLSLISYDPLQKAHRDNRYWLTLAISQIIGLKAARRPAYSGPAPQLTSEKKLWWSCVVRDFILSVAYQQPPYIRLDEFDVERLDIADLYQIQTDRDDDSGKPKLILAQIMVSMMDLAALAEPLLRKRYNHRAKQTNGNAASERSILTSLLAAERESTELLVWQNNFLDKLGKEMFLDSAMAGSPHGVISKTLPLHRNVALLMYSLLRMIVNSRFELLSWSTHPSLTKGVALLLGSCWDRAKQAATEVSNLVTEIFNLDMATKTPYIVCHAVMYAGTVQALSSPTGPSCGPLGQRQQLRVCMKILETSQAQFCAFPSAARLLRTIVRYVDEQTSAIQKQGHLLDNSSPDLTVSSDEKIEQLPRKIAVILKALSLLEPSLWLGDDSMRI